MKSLQECKEKALEGFPFKSVDDLLENHRTLSQLDDFINQAAKLYAQEACREQREICARRFDHGEQDELLVKLIKNAPEPKLS